MGKTIEDRRRFSEQRFSMLRQSLEKAEEICADRACVYATGSFGRGEASAYSDIDLFIVSLWNEAKRESHLSKLKEIVLKAELIHASERLEFPPFSQDGRFLQQHSERKLIEATGDPKDDFENTFTARLLLLLESQPLTARPVHSKIIDDVIAKYWSEYSRHSECFMPGFLANDILRYWRTLCLNYEANTSNETAEQVSKRRLDNYKLKHSRMLTCYSALLVLLHIFVKNGTVTVEDAQRMVYQTPTERIGWLAADTDAPDVSHALEALLEKYERFLEVTNKSKDDLRRLFSDPLSVPKLKEERSMFGDLICKSLYHIGRGNDFYRRLVV